MSFPSWELFADADADTQEAVMRPELPSLAVEAGVAQGWHQWVDDVVSIDRFGASAPGGTVMRELGINVDNVVAEPEPSSAPDAHLSLDRRPHVPLARSLRSRGPEPVARQHPTWLDHER